MMTSQESVDNKVDLSSLASQSVPIDIPLKRSPSGHSFSGDSGVGSSTTTINSIDTPGSGCVSPCRSIGTQTQKANKLVSNIPVTPALAWKYALDEVIVDSGGLPNSSSLPAVLPSVQKALDKDQTQWAAMGRELRFLADDFERSALARRASLSAVVRGRRNSMLDRLLRRV